MRYKSLNAEFIRGNLYQFQKNFIKEVPKPLTLYIIYANEYIYKVSNEATP